MSRKQKPKNVNLFYNRYSTKMGFIELIEHQTDYILESPST